MNENFAFLKKSDLRKSILGRSDFFRFFDFSLSMQICYSPFRYVLSIFNYSQEAWQQELKYKSKIAKNLWNITNQHIFSCWAQIWPPFCSNFRAPLSKIHFFAIFGVKTPFLASSSVLLSHGSVFNFTLTRTDMNTGSMRIFWLYRNCRGLKTGQKWAKLTKISIFVKLITVIQNFLVNLIQSSQN